LSDGQQCSYVISKDKAQVGMWIAWCCF